MIPAETEVQREIRASVRKLCERRIPAFQSEQYYGTLPRELFASFAEIGLTGLTVDEEFGGLGLGPITAALAMEEIAAVDLGPAIFLSVHLMVSGLIARSGNAEQKSRLLPDLASGKLLAAFALTESSAGSDAAALKTTARENGDHFVINGSKCWITSAGYADRYLVFAKTSPEKGKDGVSAFIVNRDNPGLIIGKPEKKMGCELSPIATLSFDNMKISKADLIGVQDQGFKVALGGLAGGRVNIAACANGLSRSAIRIATKHLQEREQFGSKLIEFQGLQFILADMATKAEAARLLTTQAAATIERDPNDRQARIQSSMAKCFATDAAMAITTDAVQLLGGAGYVREYNVERLMRDAKMLQIVEGTNQIQRVLISREVIAAS